ncbi:MAG: protein jag [Spirochaetales bacterium]|nr:protein jag [Spirochaetales bacterium]
MIQEFEGKTEQEAIENALDILGVKRDEITIEVIEDLKPKFLFGKKRVKIKVYFDAEEDKSEGKINKEVNGNNNGELAEKIIQFLTEIINRMGIHGHVEIQSKDNERIIFDIESHYSGILIGKKGKTLDALQLLVNVYAGKMKAEKSPRLIIDTEDYRSRRERSLISYAQKIANQVRRTRSSILLEAMNPFERRLIHTALNDLKDVETISEGDGLYKKIRVQYRYKGRKR